MADPVVVLTSLLQDALGRVLGPSFSDADPVLRPSDHADYQSNAAMSLGKQVGRAPRELAAEVVEALSSSSDASLVLESTSVAGPGFINLTLSDSFLASLVASASADDRLGVPVAGRAMRVVVDYSSPNVAKEMHVGHLRSTVIGDSLVRLFSWLGHDVVRQNHLGDWGTQFGMLIEHLVDTGAAGEHISDLNALYQEAKQRFDADTAFAERARGRVVLLQSGDAETLALWHSLVAESERHFEQVYGLLGVLLTLDDVRGESFYNDKLEDTIAELDRLGLVKVDDGALCAFPPGFSARDGSPLPLIVRKSDGGFGYAATDLAGARFRAGELGGDRLLYVVDSRQSQHLSMVFAVAEMAGWLGGSSSGGPGGPGGSGGSGGSGASATHVAFGTVLGPDGRPFKTREGETVRLLDLLEEAIERAAAAVESKNPALSAAEKDVVARQVGIGAVKFADLSNDRVKDYVFNWDRMLTFDGNTAPYLQYAHARIKSIFRRAAEDGLLPAGSGAGSGFGPGAAVVFSHAAERALAVRLLSFGSSVEGAASNLQPHRLAGYLFELASAFTTFFEACPVLRAESDDIRASRFVLCELTARTLSVGLGLLGIEAPDRM